MLPFCRKKTGGGQRGRDHLVDVQNLQRGEDADPNLPLHLAAREVGAVMVNRGVVRLQNVSLGVVHLQNVK